MAKALIIIATYNEKDNIRLLIQELRQLYPGLDILVLDDNSCDTTSEIVRSISQKDKRVKLISRKKKEGLGKALLCGYKYALDNGYRNLIQMDADFSHPPVYISRLLDNLDSGKVLVCSRFIKGAGFQDCPWVRIFISRSANLISRVLLGLKVKDLTSGFRSFPDSFLKILHRTKLVSKGYFLQVEVIYRALKAGYEVKELPFIYRGRERGKSKLNFLEILKSWAALFKLALQKYSAYFL